MPANIVGISAYYHDSAAALLRDGEIVAVAGEERFTRKKLWLAPIIIVMVLLGALIVLAQGSAVAPFLYTLF